MKCMAEEVKDAAGTNAQAPERAGAPESAGTLERAGAPENAGALGRTEANEKTGETNTVQETKPEVKEPRREGRWTRPQGGPPSEERGGRKTYFRKKVCKLCLKKAKAVDYKDVDLLRRFITERGKILPRRITGTCAKHQRMVSGAIKRARMVALLPFVSK